MDYFGINTKANITADGVADLVIENTETSGTIALKGNDSGSASQFLLKGNPDGSLDLYYDGALVASTTANGITNAVWG
jgi:hypothetical protein